MAGLQIQNLATDEGNVETSCDEAEVKRLSKFISLRAAVKMLIWCFVASWMLAMFSVLSDPVTAREGYLFLRVDFLALLVIGALGFMAIWRIG